jgi:hypothetical protein
MPGGFAPRFAIEAGFLILLGAGSGYANLRTAVIVAVLAGGWLLVSLIELTVWRAQARPVGAFVPPGPAAEGKQEDTIGVNLQQGADSAPEPVEPEEIAYPLRADASEQPSEEIEAYTRVLAGQPEGGPPDERADG